MGARRMMRKRIDWCVHFGEGKCTIRRRERERERERERQRARVSALLGSNVHGMERAEDGECAGIVYIVWPVGWAGEAGSLCDTLKRERERLH
jgi:hypothetical protein